jgi:hypothetical protein
MLLTFTICPKGILAFKILKGIIAIISRFMKLFAVKVPAIAWIIKYVTCFLWVS